MTPAVECVIKIKFCNKHTATHYVTALLTEKQPTFLNKIAQNFISKYIMHVLYQKALASFVPLVILLLKVRCLQRQRQ